MKNLISIVFFCLLSLLFGDCQKKLFGHVCVKGRLLSFYSETPISNRAVTLSADYYQGGIKSTVIVAEGKTNVNGIYILRGKPYKSNKYYVTITSYKSVTSLTGSAGAIGLERGKEKNLGDFKTGTEVFYCNININLSSGAVLTFNRPGHLKSFTGPIKTTIIDSIESQCLRDCDKLNSFFYSDGYYIKKPNSTVTLSSEFIAPLTKPSKVASVEINY